MRKFARYYIVSLLLTLALGICCLGCHAQVAPNPTTFTCPATTGTAYAPLNQTSPATGLTYVDSKPASGTYCYCAQSEVGSAVSLPSNVAGPFTTSGTNSVDLSWTAPTSGPTPAGYYISRAPAVASTLLAPNLGATVAALRAEGTEVAKGAPVGLKGSVGR